MTEVYLQTKNGRFIPAVHAGMVWETQRFGVPGRLQLQAQGDVDFPEGALIRVAQDGAGMFEGFVFTKQQSGLGEVTVTAYDQLRYFKNKDSYLYEGKKASEVTVMLAADFGLKIGVIEDTGWVIPYRLEDGAELFDIVKNALEETRLHTGGEYVLYDDCGRLALRNAQAMRVPILVCGETASGYSYQSSIDRGTTTRVKLVYDNRKTGARQIFMAEDAKKQKEWGVLQYFGKLDELVGAQDAAHTLLKTRGNKTLELSVSGVLGDRRVRAGCSVEVSLELADRKAGGWMVVERARHRWDQLGYTMDLVLSGGGFVV